MRIRKIAPVVLVLVLAVPGLARAQSADEGAEIEALMKDAVDVQKKTPGVVVGIVDAKGARFYSRGLMDVRGDRAVGPDTVFEIGSVTKTFTSLLLADMVVKGEVKLDDPISKYLPAGVKAPSRNGREITFLDLATHTSGLPRMPSNIKPADPTNPYKDYTVDKVFEYLNAHKLNFDVGANYLYSNIGAGVLGQVLAFRDGKDYETLARERILAPLGMSDTTITLSGSQADRFATPHDDKLKPTSPWDFTGLAGAGAIRSTARDMLKYAAANLGLVKTPLAEAMALTHETRRVFENMGLALGLGWHLVQSRGALIIWHNGGTGGFRSYLGLCPKTGTGIVVLNNSSVELPGLGLKQLVEPLPEKRSLPLPNEVPVDPSVLAGCAGTYTAGGFAFEISPEAGHLSMKVPGQSGLALFPASAERFFARTADVDLTFGKDEGGRVTRVILEQPWLKMECRRKDL
jgi:D-alanyl-D-alanine-carboxypeptidase/D-alanyl-D-alanine-endopeptidase